MPTGINLPKATIALVATASGLVGGLLGFFLLAFGLGGSPDYSFDGEQLVYVLAPVGLAVFCGWLLRRYADPMRRAGRDVHASLTAPVWLANLLFALILAFYFLDDATAGGAQYQSFLVDKEFLRLLAAASFLTAFGCAWAIARSLSALLALPLTALLAGALYVSEASSVWLGL